jgi:hypothetical protein
VQVRTAPVVPIIVIQEAGLDGFWIHPLLQDERVESHVVDLASMATSRPAAGRDTWPYESSANRLVGGSSPTSPTTLTNCLAWILGTLATIISDSPRSIVGARSLAGESDY